MSLGPYDLTGEPFLALYAILLAAALAAGYAIPHLLRPAGRPQHVADAEQLAFLAGGPGRFREAVVIRLLAARALVMAGANMFRVVPRDRIVTPAERSVLALRSPFRWREIVRVLDSHAEPVERRMIAGGLLTSREQRRNIQLLTMLPYLLLFAFGAGKVMVGIARDRPVAFLVLLLAATAVLAFIRWAHVDQRTRAGQAALADARRRAQRLKIAPTAPETDLAVALYGTAVLVGSGWAGFHQLGKDRPGGGAGCGGGNSCGGGCGGGGGGGGGCGGCGG
jgi:uncharacterized protein (TIGR04222 family)